MTVYAAAAALKREPTEPTVGQTVILTRVVSRATAIPEGEDPRDEIAGRTKEAGVLRTAVIMVGRTLGAEQFRDSHPYSPERERHVCRQR